MSLNIKDFYLNNELPRKEYARIHLSLIPQDIIDQYHLNDLVAPDGFVYIEISKGMYGLPQAGKIASDFLIPRLKAAGYHPAKHTHGLFNHDTNGITFCLVVDCLLYTSPSPRDLSTSRMPSSA